MFTIVDWSKLTPSRSIRSPAKVDTRGGLRRRRRFPSPRAAWVSKKMPKKTSGSSGAKSSTNGKRGRRKSSLSSRYVSLLKLDVCPCCYCCLSVCRSFCAYREIEVRSWLEKFFTTAKAHIKRKIRNLLLLRLLRDLAVFSADGKLARLGSFL